MTETPKLCKDCKRYLFAPIQDPHHPHLCRTPRFSLITGQSETSWCEIERRNQCGPEGKFWEAKETEEGVGA
jgi:hypothetical protein